MTQDNNMKSKNWSRVRQRIACCEFVRLSSL